jgi:hypothetical protein
MGAAAATSTLAMSNPYAAAGIGIASALGAGSSAGPSNASAKGDLAFDNSGFNVNFGAGDITSSNQKSQNGQSVPLLSGLGPYFPYLLIGAGLLIVWRMTRRVKNG